MGAPETADAVDLADLFKAAQRAPDAHKMGVAHDSGPTLARTQAVNPSGKRERI